MSEHTVVPSGAPIKRNGAEFTINVDSTIAHCEDIESACAVFGCKVLQMWDFDLDLKKQFPKLAELMCELGVRKPEKWWIIGNDFLAVPHLVVSWGEGVYVIAGAKI